MPQNGLCHEFVRSRVIDSNLFMPYYHRSRTMTKPYKMFETKRLLFLFLQSAQSIAYQHCEKLLVSVTLLY